MNIVKEHINFERGAEPKKGLRIGKYKPGAPKSFEEAEPGDPAIDYSGEEYTVVKLFQGNLGDPDDQYDLRSFIEKYDSTGAIWDLPEKPEEYGYQKHQNIKLAAVRKNHVATYVFTYGPDGVQAVW